MLSMMGEDFVSQRQQRTGEMVRMKNLREEKILALKIGGKRGGLEANKRYTMNKFQKERQRLVKDLERMKLLRARPRYSETLPDILTLDVEKKEDQVEPKPEDQEKTADEKKVEIVEDKKAEQVIGKFGLSPRQEKQTPPKADDRTVDSVQTTESNVTKTMKKKGKRKKGKLERMYEKSADEFKRAQDRMFTFMEALEDEEKWEMFRMLDSVCMERAQDSNQSAHVPHDQGTEGVSQTGQRSPGMDSKKVRPRSLDEMNMDTIKDNIAKRLGHQNGQGSSPPAELTLQVPNARKSPGLLIVSPDGSQSPGEFLKSPGEFLKSPELPSIGKQDRVGRWALQVEEAQEDHLLMPETTKRTRKISNKMVATLEPILEKEVEKRPEPESQPAPAPTERVPRHDGDWSQKKPLVEGVYIENFQGQIVYDQDLYNPDGSYRAVHTMPDFEASLEEAKKARYVRYGKDEVPEHEKDLSMNEIFGKSEEDGEILRLIKEKEAEKAASETGSEGEGGHGEGDRGHSVLGSPESSSPET